MNGRDGIVKDSVWASYLHLHALGTPEWAKGFFGAGSPGRAPRRRPHASEGCLMELIRRMRATARAATAADPSASCSRPALGSGPGDTNDAAGGVGRSAAAHPELGQS